MKKQIVVSSIIAAAILGGTAVLSVAKAEGPKSDAPQLLANNSLIAPKNPIIASASRTETVYVMTDENGNANSKFIGSTLYTGAEELPFSISTTYYLDGAEISPKDLAGKSGHVKIVFDYNSTAKKNGSFIPFIALTTMNLNHQKFTNIKLSNGKIFNENDTTYTIIGYGITGLNKNLGTSFLPDQFTFEADTTNFSLADTYTIFTSDILADVDLSELSRIDQLTNSIYQLQDAVNKLANGASDLTAGLGQALDGTKTIFEGSKKLVAGFGELKPYSTKLTDGAKEIIQSTLVGTSDFPGLNLQIQANEALMEAILHYHIDFPITTDNYIESIEAIERIAPAMTHDLEKAKNLVTFALGTIGYTNGVAKIESGATELSNGLGSLVEGQTKLYQGSITLRDGLIAFKTSGIDKLVNFASKDLTNFTRNLRNSIAAASSYKSFGGVDAKSVKFIVKAPAI